MIAKLFGQNNFKAVCGFFEQKYQTEPQLFADDATLKKIAVSYFKTGKKQSCLTVIDRISAQFLAQDFFLNEIKAECCHDFNRLDDAYQAYSVALSLNPTLVSAKYKRMVLHFRLFGEVLAEDFEQTLKNARTGKRQQWLRDIAYIYYAQGKFAEANQCLKELNDLGGQFHFLDRMTLNSLGLSANAYAKIVKDQEKVAHIANKFMSNNSKHLVVVLATHHTHAFERYKFGEDFDLLFLADLTSSYYVFILHDFIKAILAKHKQFNYDKISLVGASKAGTGALIIYQELIRHFDKTVNVIAFSPPVGLYPFNDNLLIPSYQHLSKLIDIHPMAQYLFANTKMPKDVQKRPTDKITVVYGKGYKMDATEVGLLPTDTGLEVLGLDYSGHSTSIPYTIPENKTLDDLKRIYANLADLPDEDFQALGGGQTIDLVDEIWNLYQNPEVSLRRLLLS